jgi:hypothetical protein
MYSNCTIQGGYHELQNEPDGVKEKFTDECVAWAEEHFSSITEGVTEGSNQTQARL